MGGTSFSNTDYTVRSNARAKSGVNFAYSAAVNAGTAPRETHPSLNPKGVKLREARDSAEHPVSVPISMLLDTTGSMQAIPQIIQSKLGGLMGAFLEDKASGKRYLGDGYPAIMIGAFDDFEAMRGPDGVLQVGQFESGIEIDNDLGNLWMTGNGGGNYGESSSLGMYFMARHTAHDHYEKRGRKGYVFIMTDEMAFDVRKNEVNALIGGSLEADIPLKQIIAEVQERYHLFCVIPQDTGHGRDPQLIKYWTDLLGQQYCLKLPEAEKICELVVGAVALCEEYVGIDDLTADGTVTGVDGALVALAKGRDGGLSAYSAAGLPSVGSGSETERL